LEDDAGKILPNNRYILLGSSRMHKLEVEMRAGHVLAGGFLGQSLDPTLPSSLCILLPMPSACSCVNSLPSNSNGGKPSALEIALP
jgi:hypothetical protein